MLRRLVCLFRVVRLHHTLFALPFAYLGALLGTGGWPSFQQILWITIAMFGARSAAMAWNRWVDREYDAKNPRTAQREIPTGQIGFSDVSWFTIICLLLFFLATTQLHPACIKVFPLAVFLTFFYSYTKRFTFLSHFILGMSLAFAPLGAWLAVSGSLPTAAWVWGLAVVCWVAGFDIFYQSQDVEFDRIHGLCSIPAYFGVKQGVKFALVLHAISLLLFLWGGMLSYAGTWYFLGIGIVLLLFSREYFLVRELDTARLASAFQINLMVSLVLLVFFGLDRLTG